MEEARGLWRRSSRVMQSLAHEARRREEHKLTKGVHNPRECTVEISPAGGAKLGETLRVEVRTETEERSFVEEVVVALRDAFGGGAVRIKLRRRYPFGRPPGSGSRQGGEESVYRAYRLRGGAKRVDEEVWRALVPTTPLDEVGQHDLLISLWGGEWRAPRIAEEDGTGSAEAVVDVLPKHYETENIWLTEAKAKVRNSTAHERHRSKCLRALSTGMQLWTGPFLRPCSGPKTTGYGVKRYYNGTFAQDYFHAGVDYGGAIGAAVLTPANGIVRLVGEEKKGFVMHGNCVGIDHGQGVVSLMMHLDKASVREGDFVQGGEKVGEIGDTGVATGPHLHWGLYVSGKAVDPNPWMCDDKGVDNSVRPPWT